MTYRIEQPTIADAGYILPWTNDEDVLLTVATYNDRARAFYKKLGFEDKAGTERNFADTPIPVIDMIRKARA